MDLSLENTPFIFLAYYFVASSVLWLDLLQLHHLSLHLEVVILTLLLQQIQSCDLRLESVREAGEPVIHLS